MTIDSILRICYKIIRKKECGKKKNSYICRLK